MWLRIRYNAPSFCGAFFMFIDSHCHLDFADFQGHHPDLLAAMAKNQVSHALVISVNLADFPNVLALAEQYENLYATVGVHPDYEEVEEPSVERLVQLAQHPKIIGIGETGLDYFRLQGDLEWQRERFRTHIRAARAVKKPLIIHTRAASADTLRLMQEERADEACGVLHCFTETQAVADAAIEMGFYISFSGIVSFKKAEDLRAVAKTIPLGRLLIETDSPYLAPVPHRGKTNQPAFVKHVAECIADVRGISVAEVGEASSANFARLFGVSL